MKHQPDTRCPRCKTVMKQREVRRHNPNNVTILFECPECGYYYYG